MGHGSFLPGYLLKEMVRKFDTPLSFNNQVSIATSFLSLCIYFNEKTGFDFASSKKILHGTILSHATS